jgi:hypothetical protein
MKRQRPDDGQSRCGLLKSFECVGIMELVYSFLMNKEYSEYYFLKLRTICKMTKLWSVRLYNLVMPMITSQIDATKWQAMIPNLRHMKLTKVHVKLAFLHLRSLIIHGEPVEDVMSINDWNCPLLENFESSVITTSVIKRLPFTFPNLKSLSICVKSEREIILSGFANVETLYILLTPETRVRVHIATMPKLTDFKITGLVNQLNFRFTPNLKCISSSNPSNSGMYNELLFHDPVPSLECLTLGSLKSEYGGLLQIDSNDHVHWENIKKLSVIYSHTFEKLWSRLNSIEELEIIDTMFLIINWSYLTHLKHLGWRNPSFDLLSSIIVLKQNITSLTIQWDNGFVMDFAMLLHFPNLTKVTMITTRGKYENFDSLFQIPKLNILQCSMKNLSISEKMLLTHWNIKNK